MPSSSKNGRSGSRKRSVSTADDVMIYSAPSNDSNSWYFPSNEVDSDVSDLDVGTSTGNWGKKHMKNARWVRKGKMAAWGPGMDDWEAEDRARKRMKILLPQSKSTRSPSPPSLPHLRSPTPPPTGPYPSLATQHLSYASFVLDKSVTHTFRSPLIDELEKSTNSSIEAAAVMKKALGRLWQALSEDPDRLGVNSASDSTVVPKTEPELESMDPEELADLEQASRLARAPDLTPTIYKIFLALDNTPQGLVPGLSMSGLPIEAELENMQKGLAALREVQDDGREFVERLEEVRDGLGDARNQRNNVWDIVRRKALAEMKEAALAMAQ